VGSDRYNRMRGLARSLAIHHGVPGRQQRMRQLYAQFVKPGDLVFDIGAHAGNRTRAFAALGCRVIAVEPQPDFARLLRWMFRRSPWITIVETAVGSTLGQADLAISPRTPTVTTASPASRDARAGESEFASVAWNRVVRVPVTTLDALIEQFGMPAFMKIDVEGAEPDVLEGLPRAAPGLSFEYLPRALEPVERCVARLTQLDPYLFNWSRGQSFALASTSWITGPELLDALRSPLAKRGAGDVYARRM
jgi:FkbM family methyltransferase